MDLMSHYNRHAITIQRVFRGSNLRNKRLPTFLYVIQQYLTNVLLIIVIE